MGGRQEFVIADRLHCYFYGFHTTDWNAIAASEEEQKILFIFQCEIVEYFPEQTHLKYDQNKKKITHKICFVFCWFKWFLQQPVQGTEIVTVRSCAVYPFLYLAVLSNISQS